MYKSINNRLNLLNDSKLFAGLVMILLNVGSNYITISFSKNQQQYLKNKLGRQILIFAMSWVGSRDIIISLLLTAAFTILADHLLNEESKICILPKKWKNLNSALDLNNDGKITDDEIEKAIDILNRVRNNALYDERSVAFYNFYNNL
jgi:hypothetical protein